MTHLEFAVVVGGGYALARRLVSDIGLGSRYGAWGRHLVDVAVGDEDAHGVR